MSKLSGNEIRVLAKQIISGEKGGIRYSELLRRIHEGNPETPRNTITGSVWDLEKKFPKEISKPDRGLYIAASLSVPSPVNGTLEETRRKESDLYAPFAAYLKNDLGEVSEVAVIGGATFKRKWATPDVVGVYRPRASNLFKFQPEIVSAEIKADPEESVVAFGQAIAYRLFSNKSYIVMPMETQERDKARLESLCMLFGIGFVLFDSTNALNFQIRVRAQRFNPDMFYVNKFAERLKQTDLNKFEKLFGGS